MKKVLKVMDSTGDTRVEFEAGTDAETEAKALFERLTGGNKAAAVFAVNRGDGLPDKRVRDFNELEAENVIVPAIIGG